MTSHSAHLLLPRIAPATHAWMHKPRHLSTTTAWVRSHYSNTGRVTKAAVAVGATATLLVGGPVTMAYWSANATATPATLNSGLLTASPGVCSPWSYNPAGGDDVEFIVPGDTVYSTCSIAATGQGDHLAVVAEVTGGGWADESSPLTQVTPDPDTGTPLGGVTLTVGDAQVGSDTYTPGSEFSVDGDVVITVQLTAAFAQNSPDNFHGVTGAENDVQGSTTSTQEQAVPLTDVTVKLTQIDPNGA
ncbi:MAG: alternate-type signal peptide domain-containing protein [Cellulomonadaceae bacterium]|nr:alternate-type signal peptide domain-containing protein [Cellulomonadaceae bacterium]